MQHKIRADKTQLKVTAPGLKTVRGGKKFSKRMARKRA
jgi:hypothetical protein